MPADPATIAALRSRLASLGGAVALHPARRAEPPPPEERAADLGFIREGSVVRRRLEIDLQPFLACAGGCDPAQPAGLLRLARILGPGAPDPPWCGRRGTSIGVLDIETLGLRGSGVFAFLIGLARLRGSTLEMDQLLLLDPAEEAAQLQAVMAQIAEHRLWLTYNGRTFDIPMLAARATVNRLDPDALVPRLHCDLLAPTRRLFRDRLGACTLRQAESQLLGMVREDDVPGFEAPARYRAWLHGAPAEVMHGVIEHNQLDLCATAVLAARLCAHVGGRPVQPIHPADRYNLALHLQRGGRPEEAGELLQAAWQAGAEPWSRRAGHRLARLWARLEDRGDDAVEVWSELHRREPGDLRAARALAIALERRGDLAGALAVCDRVEALRSGLDARFWERWRGGGSDGAAEWSRRRLRLERRRARRRPVLPLGLAASGR